MLDKVILMNTTMTKSYFELIKLSTFMDRYKYLRLDGRVGVETFGYDRYLNQILYHTPEWRRFRRDIIVRDKACDLGCAGYELYDKILIHHLNPITVNDVLNRDPKIFDPNNVISTSLNTHNAIHYGDERLLVSEPIVRTKNDTCPWKTGRS